MKVRASNKPIEHKNFVNHRQFLKDIDEVTAKTQRRETVSIVGPLNTFSSNSKKRNCMKQFIKDHDLDMKENGEKMMIEVGQLRDPQKHNALESSLGDDSVER